MLSLPFQFISLGGMDVSVKITAVLPGSAAAKKRIAAGDTLLCVNDHPINDILDYQFYIQEEKPRLLIQTEKGKQRRVRLRLQEGEDPGLEFESYLMDEQRPCSNNCVFCFVHQMPKGMRKTLYFKDDDARLSFLFGNYITLTNLSERDVERILEMHISPVNVSVHTMNPALRVAMMKNPNAGTCLRLLKRFADAGIELNTQLVLCPGINDGEELAFSLSELEKLMPALRSIAAVPVGLTKFREHLPHLEAYTPETAKQVIETVDSFGEKCLQKYGRRVAYCADEFYLLAGLPMPDEDYYEDYPQLENGVGLWKSLETEFSAALEDCELPADTVFAAALATGAASAPLMRHFASLVQKRFPASKIDVYAIENDFFGHSITVAGLVTGRDLIAQLKNKELHGRLLIPAVMLKSDEDVFLDDISTKDVERELGVTLTAVPNSGDDLLRAMIGQTDP